MNETPETQEPSSDYVPLDELPPMEALRLAVSAADENMKGLGSKDPDERINAVLDFANLLRHAKRVVLGS